MVSETYGNNITNSTLDNLRDSVVEKHIRDNIEPIR